MSELGLCLILLAIFIFLAGVGLGWVIGDWHKHGYFS
jgi:hypothetical protein